MTVYLNGVAQVDGATKEFFFAPAMECTVGRQGPDGDHAGIELTTGGDFCHIECLIPHDFTTLTSIELVCIALTTGNSVEDITTDYGAAGEARNTHSEAIGNLTTAVVDNTIYEIDISAATTVLAAGDYVGIKVIHDATHTADILVLGVKLRYS